MMIRNCGKVAMECPWDYREDKNGGYKYWPVQSSATADPAMSNNVFCMFPSLASLAASVTPFHCSMNISTNYGIIIIINWSCLSITTLYTRS